ncbi:hypothetical protein HY632_00240 [Candidatus Uhrbacteria bacterium]|nr:hypothetical protein [Candidatus Uhrbacteria bacterium]
MPIARALVDCGFSRKEIAILLALYQRGRMITAEVARTANMPRSTAAFVLRQLSAREAVLRTRIAKHDEWEAAEPDQLYQQQRSRLLALKEVLPEIRACQQPMPKEGNLDIVSYYRGVRGMQRAYDALLELRRGERILFFEGGGSTLTKLRMFHDQYLMSWQRTLRRRGIILEIAVSEKIVDIIRAAPTDLLRATFGRAIIATTIPEDAMHADSDVFVFRKTVMIITPEKRLAIVIHDSSIARTFQKLLSFALGTGRKIDLNAFTRTVLQERAQRRAPVMR